MDTTMRCVTHNDLSYYTCDLLSQVKHAFTCKAGGVSTGECASLNLGFGRGDSRENIMKNYEILLGDLDMPLERLTMTQQVHQDKVEIVTENKVGTGLFQPLTWQADALVTALPHVPLAGFYADCVVTLLFDPVSHTIGVCHAGWRGTAQQILTKTVDTMVRELGTQRQSLRAVIGPSIRQCCFETDGDVPEAMLQQLGRAAAPYIKAQGAKFYLDLQGLNHKALADAGVSTAHIIDSGLCTRCNHSTFWSHRATNGKRGVQAAIICL